MDTRYSSKNKTSRSSSKSLSAGLTSGDDNSKDKKLPSNSSSHEIIVPEEEKRLITVLTSLDVGDKEALGKAIGELIASRLMVETKLIQGIGVGVMTDVMSVNDAIGMLPKVSKDSLSELVKVHRLTTGASDDGEVSVVEALYRDGTLQAIKAALWKKTE